MFLQDVFFLGQRSYEGRDTLEIQMKNTNNTSLGHTHSFRHQA
jgi:hypothetical protein